MRRKNILIIVLAIIASACQTTSRTKEISLGTSINLYGDAKEIGVDLYRPSKMYILDNHLIIFDDVKKNIFKIFSIPSMEYRYSYGHIGEGPKEFRNISKDCINITDGIEILQSNKLYKYFLTDSTFIKDNSQLILTSISPINNFCRINDSLYIFNNSISKENTHEFASLNVATAEETRFGKIDNSEIQIKNNDIEVSKYLSKAICHSNDARRFAAFYYHRPIFKIYNDQQELLQTVTLNDHIHQGFNPELIYFTEPFATDQHIYVMWICKSKKDVGMDLEGYRPDILVFNWEGQLVNRFTLNKPVITFAVVEKTQKLYAVSFMDTDLNKIYEYSLPTSSTNNQTSSLIYNNFYTLSPLTNYHFSSKEECNNEQEEEGYLINRNYLSTGKLKKEGIYAALGSIKINYYQAKKDSCNLKKKIEKILNHIYHKASVTQIDTLQIGEKQAIRIFHTIQAKDFNGKESPMYFNTYLFSQKKSVVELSVCLESNHLPENWSKVTPDIEKMIRSFSAKESERKAPEER